MPTKSFEYNINNLNPILLEQDYENFLSELSNQPICWQDIKFDLKINIDCATSEFEEYFAKHLINENSESYVKLLQHIKIIDFITDKVVNLSIHYNVINNRAANEEFSKNFARWLMDWCCLCKNMEYLKITTLEGMNCCFNFENLLCIIQSNGSNLKCLDLKSLVSPNDLKYHTNEKHTLNFIENMFKAIPSTTKLESIFLPSFFRKSVFLKHNSKKNLYDAIVNMLTSVNKSIKIYPLSFIWTMGLDHLFIVDSNKGIIEYLYNYYQDNLKVIRQINSICNTEELSEELIELLNEKKMENSKILDTINNFLSNIATMNSPYNIYWLEKFLAEEDARTDHILGCLHALDKKDQTKEYLYKTLDRVMSSLITFQEIKEKDPDASELTGFVAVSREDSGNINRKDLINTLFKLNKIFNFVVNRDLRVLYIESIREYVNPTTGGCLQKNDFLDLKLSLDSNFNEIDQEIFFAILDNLRLAAISAQINAEIVNLEEKNRKEIILQMLEEHHCNTLLFNQSKNLYAQEDSSRKSIALEQLSEIFDIANGISRLKL